MEKGVATVSLDPGPQVGRRRVVLPCCDQLPLRSYVLGPENSLLQAAVFQLDAKRVPSNSNTVLTTTSDTASDVDRQEITHRIALSAPLTFIHAPSGYGKTQLLFALAAATLRHQPDSSLLYQPAVEFADGLASASKLDDSPSYLNRYQHADTLLLDDLDDLQTRHHTQHQLAAVVDHRLQYGRPTLLTGRARAYDMKLSAHLRSRLTSGLVIPLQTPSEQTRRVVLDLLAQDKQFSWSDDACDWLIQNGPQSIAALIGLVNRLLVYEDDSLPELRLDRKRRRIDIAHVRRVTATVSNGRPAFEPKAVIRTTAKYFGLSPSKVTGTSRRKLEVLARSIAMLLIRESLHLSYQHIGRFFSNRDHTTVMHACNKLRESDTDTPTRKAIDEIRQQLKQLKGTRSQCA